MFVVRIITDPDKVTYVYECEKCYFTLEVVARSYIDRWWRLGERFPGLTMGVR